MRGDLMYGKPVWRHAARWASLALISGAITVVAASAASAATPSGIQGSGHNAVSPSGIQGSGH